MDEQGTPKNVVVLDIRERLKLGEHPRQEVIEEIKKAPLGTILVIHTPHYPAPLILMIDSLGYKVIVKELARDHYTITVAKI